VRYRNKSGKHMLVASFSYFDPKQTFSGTHVLGGEEVAVTSPSIPIN